MSNSSWVRCFAESSLWSIEATALPDRASLGLRNLAIVSTEQGKPALTVELDSNRLPFMRPVQLRGRDGIITSSGASLESVCHV